MAAVINGGPADAWWRQLGDAEAVARIVAFQREFDRRQATAVIDVPVGFVVTNHRYPASYDHNKLVVTSPNAVTDVVAAAERAQSEAGFAHRLVVAGGDTTPAVAAGFVAVGHQHEVLVVLRYRGRSVADREAATTVVGEASLAELRDLDRREWRRELPDAPADHLEQLVARRAARRLGADHVEFLAVRDATGAVVATADLYVDPRSGVAQLEDVKTDQAHRNRGHARAILADGARRARSLGAHVLFLVATADDWPRHLYTRVGYAEVGQAQLFSRPA